MFEIVAGRLCFDGQPITDELPAAFRMRLEEYLAQNLLQDVAERVDDLHKWEVIIRPDESLQLQPEYELRLTAPAGYTEDTLVSMQDVLDLLT